MIQNDSGDFRFIITRVKMPCSRHGGIPDSMSSAETAYYGYCSDVSWGIRRKEAKAKDSESMRIVSFIEDREIIKTILSYLGLWLIRSKPLAKAHAPPAREYAADGPCHTAFPEDAVYGDPDYSWDAYMAT